MMAYILKPRWARWMQRAFFLTRYALLGCAGLVAVTTLPSLTMHVVGWTLIVGAFSAMTGVSTGRFHLELVPMWFLIAALVAAAGVLFSSDRTASGVLVLALVPGLCERLLHLSLVAAKARALPPLTLVEDDDARQGH